MNTKSFTVTARMLVATIALLGTGPALSAVTLASGANTGPLRSPDSFTVSFENIVNATTGTLAFDLLGYKSLDGFNRYRDVFTLWVNDAKVFRGSFNMGGGGESQAWGSAGMSWSTITNGCAANPCTDATFKGGSTHVEMPISLIDGSNSIRFAYASPTSRGGRGQGLGDEGWGVGSYTVTAVPEPETYAMFLAGLGMIGFMARRRRKG